MALQRLPVTFCLARGGLVGEDGATHHGVFDLAYFSCIPNMIVAAPMNELELRNMLYTATKTPSPYSLRYPRGCGEGLKWQEAEFEMIPTGVGRELKLGNDLALLTIGVVGNFATEAIAEVESEGKYSVAHYDLRFAKPLDEALIKQVGEKFRKIIVVEDGVLRGGVGEAVVKCLSENGYRGEVRTLGIEDKYIEHGPPAELYSICGFDAEGIKRTIKMMLQ